MRIVLERNGYRVGYSPPHCVHNVQTWSLPLLRNRPPAWPFTGTLCTGRRVPHTNNPLHTRAARKLHNPTGRAGAQPSRFVGGAGFCHANEVAMTARLAWPACRALSSQRERRAVPPTSTIDRPASSQTESWAPSSPSSRCCHTTHAPRAPAFASISRDVTTHLHSCH